MRLEYNYWYFKSAIKESICDDIVNHADKHKEQEAGIDNKEPNKKIRDSNITWLNDSWIYELINPYIKLANKNANWNFDIDSSEYCQLATYRKNQFYNWHRDTHDKSADKIRKLSVTVNLSDSKNYSGGELEFDFKDNAPDIKNQTHICKEILPKGSIVVFPSHVWHKVKPITSGERKSLVIWNLGKPFK